MALNFPNSPGIGSVYTDTVSGFSYEWNGTVWKSYSPAGSSNIRILDDISGSFNGIGKTFAITSNTVAISPPSPQSLIINLGGVVQDPTDDYSVSGSNIIFSDAPTSGLTFSGVSLGPAVPISTIPDGATTQGSLNVVGVLSAANLIVSGVSTFTNGPLFIGAATSTGTASQPLQVTGGAYVSGNLGVGVTNPSAVLDIRGNPWFSPNTTGVKATALRLGRFSDSANAAYDIITDDNTGDDIEIQSNRYTGNIRISRGSPSGIQTTFQIYSHYQIGNSISIADTTGTTTKIKIDEAGNTFFNNTGAVLIGSATSTGTASQRLQVTGNAYVSGALGIGVTNPSTVFQINATPINATGNSDVHGLRINAANSSTAIHIGANGTDGYGWIQSATWGTAYRNTILNPIGGNVGIATTNPTQALHVVGNALITGNITGAAATFTNLTVNGTQTIINTTTLEVADKNIGIGSTSTPTDTLADGSGITIYGTTNKTLTYNNTKKGFETNIPIATNETRIISGAEKVHRQSGNTVTLTYNSSSSSNVGYTTNPTANITVNVVGIPTSSDFDDHSITFAVIVNNTGTARTCTAVNLNGTSRTIRWAGGSLSAALSGVTTTTGHTIFSFTGINTIGSASTSANYEVLGVVSGGFW